AGGGAAGGGANDARDLTPDQRAEQAAIQQLQQITDRMSITASADTITFTDTRGQRTFEINDKSTKINGSGAAVTVKSKWDKNTLKQEFSNSQANLTEMWSVDDSGHLVRPA